MFDQTSKVRWFFYDFCICNFISNFNGVWKSSNFTTVPFTLAPKDHQGFAGNGGGAAGNKQVKMGNKHEMGKKSVTFIHQKEFSRGDSIGDISGEVRIHNTGTVPVAVNCG